ncbi:MAG: ABC transporter permease [Bacilli bacterium]|nr:ABC transporter permease [Bacilli bacterium]
MQLAEDKKKRFSLPFHVVKKLDISKKKYWMIKFIGILIAFLLAGLICTILRPGTFGTFYTQMFLGCFSFGGDKFVEFLICLALLMLVAFALAPAFKMKFWNIGGEGQILVGCLVTAGIMKFMGEANINDGLIIVVCLLSAVMAGIIWGVLPAIFKAFFNTNETLFTLMMNYVAAGLIALMINVWVPNGSQVFEVLTHGNLPNIFGVKYIFGVLIAVVVVALVTIYLKKTKHGYELSVVGESSNTARYVGINVKKVTIRTMVLSGAICGLVGFILVAGYHHTLTSTLAAGRGFTGVLIAWLGGFEPIQMILYAFLVTIFQRGSINAASYVNMNTEHFSAIVTGMFFLIVIATEFFVNYQIMFKNKEEKAPKKLTMETVPSYSEVEEDDTPVDEKEMENPVPEKVEKPSKTQQNAAKKASNEKKKPAPKKEEKPSSGAKKKASKKTSKEAK